MSDYSWPPADDLLAWRPKPDGALVTVDFDGEEVGACELARIFVDAERPGGGSLRTVYAISDDDGVRIVITDDDEIGFVSPLPRLPDVPTFGEILRILDGAPADDVPPSGADGESMGVGHPTRVMNNVDGDRESLRGFVTIDSDLYPMLRPVDEARFEAWVAEGRT